MKNVPYRFYWIGLLYYPVKRKLYMLSPDFEDVLFVKQLESYDYMSEDIIHSYKSMLYEKIKQQRTLPYPSDIDQVKTFCIAKFSEITGFTVSRIFNDITINLRNIKLFNTENLPIKEYEENDEITEEDTIDDFEITDTCTNTCEDVEFMTIEKIQFFTEEEISEIAMMIFAESFIYVIDAILNSDNYAIDDESLIKKDMSIHLEHNLYPCKMNAKEQEIFFAKVYHQLKGFIAYLTYTGIEKLCESCKPIDDLLKIKYTELKKINDTNEDLIDYTVVTFLELFEEALYQERIRIENILYPTLLGVTDD